jgi:hypothetical protein
VIVTNVSDSQENVRTSYCRPDQLPEDRRDPKLINSCFSLAIVCIPFKAPTAFCSISIFREESVVFVKSARAKEENERDCQLQNC